MNEYYKKVFISSEEDLPQQEGIYKGSIRYVENIVTIHYFPHTLDSINFWLNNVLYYFVPCLSDIARFEKIIALQKELIERLKEGGLIYNPETININFIKC